MNNDFLIHSIKSVFDKKGYAFFTKGIYNLNIFGVRSSNLVVNLYDDLLCCVYRDKMNLWQIHTMVATTDPGKFWMENPMKKEGCAILVEDQYRGLWKLGLHRGKYKALVQKEPCKVYRDNNKNDILDLNPSSFQKGQFGINCHKGGFLSALDAKLTDSPVTDAIKVGKWSAGCQVVREEKNHYDPFIAIIEESLKYWPNSFTYTLFNESDFEHLKVA